MSELVTTIILGVWWLVCALVASGIADGKHRNGFGWFLATLVWLGPLGLAAALVVEPGEPRAPRQPAAVSAEPPGEYDDDTRGLGWAIRSFFSG